MGKAGELVLYLASYTTAELRIIQLAHIPLHFYKIPYILTLLSASVIDTIVQALSEVIDEIAESYTSVNAGKFTKTVDDDKGLEQSYL